MKVAHFSRVNVCFVACISVGAEEHGDQSVVAGVVRDSAEALPEIEGNANGRVWYS